MFKNRRRKVAVLEILLERLSESVIKVKKDEKLDEDMRSKLLNDLDEIAYALIDAIIAYNREPFRIAVAIVCAVITGVVVGLM